jgi:hypothetical protein
MLDYWLGNMTNVARYPSWLAGWLAKYADRHIDYVGCICWVFVLATLSGYAG